MGGILTCGSVCSWSQTSMASATPDGTMFVLNRNTTQTFQFKWSNCEPPDTPCADPQSVRVFFRWRRYSTDSWGSWTQLPSSKSACSDSGTDKCNTSDSLGVTASADVWYEIEIFFCAKGWFEISAEAACTVGSSDTWAVRPIRVLVT